MRLAEQYKKEIVPKLTEQFGYSNVMAVPRVKKVTINVGVGRHTKDKAYIDGVVDTLRRITGQQPVLTKARKSIASFKLREGSIVGVTVTLRGERMYDFLQKLVHITFPRVRDFRGISAGSFDKTGNYSVGMKDTIAFPEVRAEDIEKVHGLEVAVTTTATTAAEGEALLRLMGFPFKAE